MWRASRGAHELARVLAHDEVCRPGPLVGRPAYLCVGWDGRELAFAVHGRGNWSHAPT